MSPIPVATPPPIIEEARRTSDAVMQSFRMAGEAVRRILSTRKLLLSKKATKKHLAEAVADFERSTAEFQKRLENQRELLARLAKENDRLVRKHGRGEIQYGVADESDDPLFFTHIREAWHTLRGRHA